MKVERAIDYPIRPTLSWAERWQGSDRGLISAWEAGRELGLARPESAAAARGGRLMPLPWKGGLEEPPDGLPKKKSNAKKYGSLLYLAMWQGLGGRDLSIDTDVETVMTCPLVTSTVVFTADTSKYVAD